MCVCVYVFRGECARALHLRSCGATVYAGAFLSCSPGCSPGVSVGLVSVLRQGGAM